MIINTGVIKVENKYFSVNDTLYEITDRYPELIDLLANKGFEQLKDDEKRKAFGSKISLKQATMMKSLDLDKLVQLLITELDNSAEQRDIDNGDNDKKTLKITGLLPCPVKMPLLEGIDQLENEISSPIKRELKSASQGLDWLKESIEDKPSAEKLSDLYISAGFDLFFDRDLMDHYRRKDIFKDTTGLTDLNNDFVRNDINLFDPEGDYSIIGVVPAVFLVNQEELAGREAPKTWADLLKPEFENSISLPVSDFDLFNAILINIYKKYGSEGVEKLGRSMQKSLHPSEMVKEGGRKKQGEPAVTIMPYFFTRMAKRFPHMEFVWPEDGAIISPIFMLIKESSLPELQPVVDFFASKEVGSILSEQGLFPSVRADIDNNLPENSKFMWPGWDFLRENNPGELIDELTNKFNQTAREAI